MKKKPEKKRRPASPKMLKHLRKVARINHQRALERKAKKAKARKPRAKKQPAPAPIPVPPAAKKARKPRAKKQPAPAPAPDVVVTPQPGVSVAVMPPGTPVPVEAAGPAPAAPTGDDLL